MKQRTMKVRLAPGRAIRHDVTHKHLEQGKVYEVPKSGYWLKLRRDEDVIEVKEDDPETAGEGLEGNSQTADPAAVHSRQDLQVTAGDEGDEKPSKRRSAVHSRRDLGVTAGEGGEG